MINKRKERNDAEWAIQQIENHLYYLDESKKESYLCSFYLFDKKNRVPEEAIKHANKEIECNENSIRLKNGEYPVLNTTANSQNRVFKCYSTENDSSYIVTFEIENNNTNGKPRRRGTKVKEVYTFPKKERQYTKETFINMEGEEELVPSYYETTTNINETDIEHEYASINLQETKTEFSEEQLELISKLFKATQKDEHIPVLKTALDEELVYKHYIGIGPDGDFLAEECKWRDNTLYFNYQNNPEPGYHTKPAAYEIVISVTPNGTEIDIIDGLKVVYSYSSYEDFIEHLDIDMGTANYLDIIKSRVQKLQELGIPFSKGKNKGKSPFVKVQ